MNMLLLLTIYSGIFFRWCPNSDRVIGFVQIYLDLADLKVEQALYHYKKLNTTQLQPITTITTILSRYIVFSLFCIVPTINKSLVFNDEQLQFFYFYNFVITVVKSFIS